MINIDALTKNYGHHTVVDKLNTLFEATGGWGTLQVESHDYYDDPTPWWNSLELIAKAVREEFVPSHKQAS